MKHQKELTLSITCLLLAFLCSMIWLRQKDENMAGRISPDILRFHVLANSNTWEDQELKIQVKTFLLEELWKAGADSKEAFCEYIVEHHGELEHAAETYMEGLGYDYGAEIRLAQSYFPAKAYGDIVLPTGVYDAVEVRLGDGRGRNWWCVLYPRLCFVDAKHGALPEESKELLRELLGDEDYEELVDGRGGKLKVRFLIPELAGDFLGYLRMGEGSEL